MNHTPVENFVIFVALLLLYVQISVQRYREADRLDEEQTKGGVLYAAMAVSLPK